ncbi:MAG TPA: universal stress protein [Thermoleophilaceae bacterium]|jgi:nucleotide-binding universal stress UspA family protein|nr:universal stress protein [Thermoleophilaceae bacterium]
MLDTVVWATDGSLSADRALPYVKHLGSDNATRVLVVHCVELLVGGPRSPVPVHPDEERLGSKIERQVSDLAGEGLTASLTTVTAGAGGAAQAIAEVAEREHAGLIVVGTRGHTLVGDLTLGSVTQGLLHLGVCPVLAVPAGENGGG